MPNSDSDQNPKDTDSDIQNKSQKSDTSSKPVNDSGSEGRIESTKTPLQESWGDGATSDPTAIGKYRIERALGRGGMGIVYLGLNPDTEGLVAIKTLPDNLKQANLIARFKREARLAAKVNHPNAVRVLDAGYDDVSGKHYIVTEYVDGDDLERVMASRGGQLPWPEVVGIIKSVANALQGAAKTRNSPS